MQEEAGNRHGAAGAWDSIGYAHHHLGEYPQAITCYRHAVDLYREAGDRYVEADTLTHLGDTHHAAGDIDAARAAYDRAVRILDELDHPDAAKVHAKLSEHR